MQNQLFAPTAPRRKPVSVSDTVVTLAEPIYVPERNVVLLPPSRDYLQVAPTGTPRVTLPLRDGTTREMLVVRNSPLMNHVLANLGHEVPSPILADYDWAGQVPFETQRLTAALMVSRTRAFILNELGTGKTLSALFAIDYLISKGYAKLALVVAPLSTLSSVWLNEIKLRMPRLVPVVLHGDRKERLQIARAKNWNVAIINPDGVKIIENTLRNRRPDIVVIDELATYRTRTTDRYRKLAPIVNTASWAWGMTGSPTPNGPSDAYAQIKLLRPELAGNSFRRFRDQVEREEFGRWVARPNAEQIIHALMQPATRFTLSQVTELPEVLYLTRKTELSLKQRRLVKELRDEMLAEFAEGRVTAVNAAALFNKLLQAHLGYVYTDDKSVVDLEPKGRVDTIAELVSEVEGKVLLFAPFKHAVTLLPQRLGWKTGPGGECAIVYGDTPIRDRTQAFKDFQDPHAPLRYIVAHPATMSHGLTLTQAATIIWVGPITSYETYQQANGRIRRVGQRSVQRIIHVSGSGLEDKVYRTLEARGNMQQSILQLFEDGLQ